MDMQIGDSGVVRLEHWGVIKARGAEAVKFLQGQLTNDVVSMGLGEARLAGFCSAKGRLQATFVLWKAGADEVLLACSRGLLAATLKRLSMFVLRAQCKLTDASSDMPLYGLIGAAAQAEFGSMRVWGKRDHDDGRSAIRLPDARGLVRGVIAGGVLEAEPTVTLDRWRWYEVQSGVPWIEPATVEQFVPQMLNFELLGGVDFQKGCYPGQEVVARSQYRGTLKRRMFLFDADVPMAAGQEVVADTDPSQPAGMVVNAAPAPHGGSSALIEVKLTAIESGTLHVGSADGPLLRRVELPYAIA